MVCRRCSSRRSGSRWRAGWARALAVGSLLPAVLWGVVFTDMVHGRRRSPSGLYLGSFWGLLAPVAVIGGLATVAAAVAIGLALPAFVRYRSAAAGQRAHPEEGPLARSADRDTGPAGQAPASVTGSSPR